MQLLGPFFRLRDISKIRLSTFNSTSTSTLHRRSTIFALSSGFGKCGVAVIKVSGPQCQTVISEVAGFRVTPEPRKAFLKRLKHPQTKEILDKGLVIWFPGPKSFTGEDCVELHVHGGPAVISAMLAALNSMDGLRPAQPGELTRRAFEAGKLDLTEVEGLGDLTQAETEVQRKQALRQMEGSLSRLYQAWADQLTKCVAHVEAFIDFSEEENLEESMFDETREDLLRLHHDVKTHLMEGQRGERLRAGVETVIVGAPNAGKSSLLNILSRKKTAIVSEMAGTTRDIVSCHMDVGGYPVNVRDTAGLRRGAQDPVEAEGQDRAVEAAGGAHLLLLVLDATLAKDVTPDQLPDFLRSHVDSLGLTGHVSACGNMAPVYQSTGQTRCLVVMNKTDLVDVSGLVQTYPSFLRGVSCTQPSGIPSLLQLITHSLNELCGDGGVGWSQGRHQACLLDLSAALTDATTLPPPPPPDMLAHHLRRALHSLAVITGRVTTEHILDLIFRDFCIGK